MRHGKRMLLIGVVELVALLALHFGLVHWLAESGAAAVVFSANRHTPRGALWLVIGFVVVRVVVVVLLPGMILSRAGMWYTERWKTRNGNGATN